jgi:hypothetical protein
VGPELSDVVSGGPPEPYARRRPRRWPLVAVLAAALLALAVHWGDARQRTHEFDALVGAITDSQATAAHADELVYSTRSYTMPQLISSSSATVRSGLADLIDRSAAQGATQLRQERSAIAAIKVLPWHHDVRAARARYLGYLDARLAALDDVSHGADLAEIPHAVDTPALQLARAALLAAAPSAAQRQRAQAALADPGR